MQTESTAESTRQNLNRNPYFDPTEAFKQCDLSHNGRVSNDELRYFMESKGMRVSFQDADAVAKKLDFNRDGTVLGSGSEENRAYVLYGKFDSNSSKVSWVEVERGTLQQENTYDMQGLLNL